jgi:hypothetical protein
MSIVSIAALLVSGMVGPVGAYDHNIDGTEKIWKTLQKCKKDTPKIRETIANGLYCEGVLKVDSVNYNIIGYNKYDIDVLSIDKFGQKKTVSFEI